MSRNIKARVSTMIDEHARSIGRPSFLLETLEVRSLFSAVAPSASVVADLAAISSEVSQIAVDKAAIPQQVASDKSDFNAGTGADDLSSIQDAQAQLASDSDPSNGNNDPGTLFSDRQAVAAAKAQLKIDKTILIAQIAGDTLIAKAVMANDQDQLKVDKFILAIDKKGPETATIIADVASIRTTLVQMANDRTTFAQTLANDTYLSDDWRTDAISVVTAQQQLAADALPANGADPDLIAADKQAVADAMTQLDSDTTSPGQRKQDVATGNATVLSDVHGLKVDEAHLKIDLKSKR